MRMIENFHQQHRQWMPDLELEYRNSRHQSEWRSAKFHQLALLGIRAKLRRQYKTVLKLRM